MANLNISFTFHCVNVKSDILMRGKLLFRMSYRVETSTDVHEGVLREAIHDWTKQDHDVHLVSKEGHRIFSHKTLLSFYSSHLKEIFNEPVVAFSSEPVIISLPSSSSASVTSMLKMLVTGRSSTSQRSGLREMKETARVLGIDLKNGSP